jgi:hypothetical protein
MPDESHAPTSRRNYTDNGVAHGRAGANVEHIIVLDAHDPVGAPALLGDGWPLMQRQQAQHHEEDQS